MDKKVNQLKHIDSLRGVAILMVILVHTAQSVSFIQQHEPLSSLAIILTNYGQVGIQLFFVISAYTLCISHIKRQQESHRQLKFFIRRFFRIAPMYYVGIGFYALTYGLFNWLKTGVIQIPEQYNLVNVTSNLLFMHGFYPPANSNIVPGGWSIGTEMAFYVIFPLLFMMANKLSQRSVFIVLPFTIILIIANYFIVQYLANISKQSLLNNSFWYYNISNQLLVFCLGFGLFFLEKTSRLKAQSSVIDGFLFVVFTIMALLVWYSSHLMAFFWLPIISGLSFLFLYRLFAQLNWLNPPLLQKIGQLSFSMYIFHFVFSYQMTGQLCRYLGHYLGTPSLLILCYFITILGTFILSIFSKRWIENRGVALGRSIIQRIS